GYNKSRKCYTEILVAVSLTVPRRLPRKGGRATRTHQYALWIDGTTHPRPKAPQNESRRNSLTAETYAPHGFPRVSTRFRPTDISEITATVTRYDDDAPPQTSHARGH